MKAPLRQLLAVLLTSLTTLVAAEPTPKKPNVLLILADDLGLECISSYGGT